MHTHRRRNFFALIALIALVPPTAATAARIMPTWVPWPGSPYVVSGPPEDLAIGDFNRDGLQDVATSSIEGVVSLLLGTPGGSLVPAPGSPFATGVSFIRSVQAADFDGDGNLDLAGIDTSTSSIVMLRGDGAGGLTPILGSPFPAGNYAWHMAVGDFDRDGRPDIAIADPAFPEYAAVVALNAGDGTFPLARQASYPVGENPVDILVVDLDGDGYPDLVTADNNGGTLSILMNDGTGHFVPGSASPVSTEGADPERLAAADFNEDGHIDVACVNEKTGTLVVFFGDGSGRLILAGDPIPMPAWAIAAGDVDGDGHQDIVVTGLAPRDLTLMRGDGRGHFAQRDFGADLLPATPEAMRIADMDGAGHNALVVASMQADGGNVTALRYQRTQHIFGDGFDP